MRWKCRSATKSFRTPRRTLCASLRSRNALGQVRTAILGENFQEKCRGPRSRRPVCASLRSRNAHGHVTRRMLSENNIQEKTRDQDRDAVCASLRSKRTWTCHKRHFEREFTGKKPGTKIATHSLCEAETHMDMSQEWFQSRICGKNAGEQMEHPDQTAALTLTVRTLQCGHTVWGKNVCRWCCTSVFSKPQKFMTSEILWANAAFESIQHLLSKAESVVRRTVF